ncbi:MAG: hypothetical protein JKY94_16735 [Rhodobacteraceae bacterium]|nr:hypothetical protein [Paracoccaceae bacterium]
MSLTFTCGYIGATLRLTVKEEGLTVDVSNAETLEIRIFRPDGTSVTQTAVNRTDGTDGQIQYRTVATDTAPGEVDQEGAYRYRFRVADTSLGIDGWGDDFFFKAELPR